MAAVLRPMGRKEERGKKRRKEKGGKKTHVLCRANFPRPSTAIFSNPAVRGEEKRKKSSERGGRQHITRALSRLYYCTYGFTLGEKGGKDVKIKKKKGEGEQRSWQIQIVIVRWSSAKERGKKVISWRKKRR